MNDLIHTNKTMCNDWMIVSWDAVALRPSDSSPAQPVQEARPLFLARIIMFLIHNWFCPEMATWRTGPRHQIIAMKNFLWFTRLTINLIHFRGKGNLKHTGCSVNIVFFYFKCCDFSFSVAALVFYLPFSGPSMKTGVHTEGKPREARVRNIFEKFRKKHNI